MPFLILKYNLLMLFLALDTCHALGSISLFRDDTILHTEIHETSDDYSVWLLPAVDRALHSSNILLNQLNLCAVATGPGSFTGVRIGITTAKAWNEVFGWPIVGLSRLDALASLAAPESSYVAPFTDASRGQVFGALFRRSPQGALDRLAEDMVIAPDRFLSWVLEATKDSPVSWVSTDPHLLANIPAWTVLGHSDQAILFASPFLAPAVGRLAYQLAQRRSFSNALSLDANYVRRSDAEVLRKGETPLPVSLRVPSQDLHIRKMQLRDVDAVMEIALQSPVAAQWMRESYVALEQNGRFGWIAETPSGLAAFLVGSLAAGEAEVLNLAVAPANRRRGIATALWKQALGEFRKQSVARFFLEVRESNQPAIAFYSKLGFSRTGTRPCYYREPLEAAVLMSLIPTD